MTHVWEAAKCPFERVHVDFAGPFMGNYFFILIDAYTKWPEIYVIPNIGTQITIEKCREIFSRYGIPEVLVSDNGAQFTSNEFQQFLNMNGIIHKRSAPYHPATNGQVERNVQTFKNKLKTINCNRSEINKVLAHILLNYRRTPHATTGESPSSMMFNRQIRSRLDLMIPKKDVTDDDSSVKQNQLNVRRVIVNDRVSVREYVEGNKYQFGIVVEVLGKLHYMVKLDDGRIWKRHIDQIHRIGPDIRQPVNDPIPHHYDVSPNNQIAPAPITEQTKKPNRTVVESQIAVPETPPPAQDEIITEQNITPIVTGATSNSEQRPQRKKIIRNRLTYDKQFRQISN